MGLDSCFNRTKDERHVPFLMTMHDALPKLGLLLHDQAWSIGYTWMVTCGFFMRGPSSVCCRSGGYLPLALSALWASVDFFCSFRWFVCS